MDNSVKKWLVRAGAFLVLFGFFIPSMAVSCTAFGVTQKQSFSMNTAASQMEQGILYLVLVGVVVTLIFSFLIPHSNWQKYIFIAGEGGGLALGFLSILISVLSLYAQIQQAQSMGLGGLDYGLEPGFFVLLLGYALSGFGIILDLFTPLQRDSQPQYSAPADYAPVVPSSNYEDYATAPPVPSVSAVFSPPSASARLELVRGNAPRQVPLTTPDFHIGRSSQNHCMVNDPQVSRLHIRLRAGDGTWFIQDQNSSGGTYVNGSRIQAQRLNDGDEIRIGETVFKFRA